MVGLRPDGDNIMGIPIAFAGGANPQVNADVYKKEQADRSRAHDAAVARFRQNLPGASPRPAPQRQENEAVRARLKQMSMASHKKLQFEVDQNSNDITVKVIDANTDKVIKVLPPEELQRLRHGLDQAMGALLDERA